MAGQDDIRTTAEAHEEAALPQARVALVDPGAPRTAEQKPLPSAVARKPLQEKSPAEWAYERLILYIQNFEEQLDSEHEIAMGFAGSDTGVMRIEGVGFFDPDIVTFYGCDESGAKTQLVQHVTQLNVMLRALPKQAPEEAPARIGFRLVADLEQEAAS
ncbi:DUF6173 family protein [Celeribacter indicus]|uniref:Uncharacterized protein n=1 Tax=Celeribacter indicus TaxID=1208324 RepID=A0A0B5E7E6_9RHOB|nr:DUF6173 family protein [Celeribacter indicus]AJE48986.1 hypothetical protein P73_4271 [Celeribacter indicus]SDW43010.1 hypothetical protein SAMN05443573_103195 [Celeribacter indicus]